MADRLAGRAAQGRLCGLLQWSPDQRRPWWSDEGHPLSWASVALAAFLHAVTTLALILFSLWRPFSTASPLRALLPMVWHTNQLVPPC